jgi:hypothetical protein
MVTSFKLRKQRQKSGGCEKRTRPGNEISRGLESGSDPAEAVAETDSVVADALLESPALLPAAARALDCWIHMCQKDAEGRQKSVLHRNRALELRLDAIPQFQIGQWAAPSLPAGDAVHQARLHLLTGLGLGRALHHAAAAAIAQTRLARDPGRGDVTMDGDAQADLPREVGTETITSDPLVRRENAAHLLPDTANIVRLHPLAPDRGRQPRRVARRRLSDPIRAHADFHGLFLVMMSLTRTHALILARIPRNIIALAGIAPQKAHRAVGPEAQPMRGSVAAQWRDTSLV